MKTPSFFTFALLLGGSFALLSGCKKDNDLTGTGTVTFEMENNAGGTAIKPDGTTVYTTTTTPKETFNLTTFEYFISNVVLTKADGSTYAVPNFYHLVDAANAASSHFTISGVPAGDYSGMQFMIGVDSTMTKADPLTFTGALNDLNPANGMYWAWNTGHIFLKVEGNVTSASNQALRAHIGGFRKPFGANVVAKPSFNGSTLFVRTDHSPEIHYSVDVLKIFNGPTVFPLGTFPTSMAPGKVSVQVANNYGNGTDGGGMFSVEHIHAN
ncbi:MAG: MbnP family protein [Janthinobacterium lividum]